MQHFELALAFCGGVGFGVLLQEVERSGFFGGELGGFGNFLNRRGSGHFRQQLNTAVVLEARTGRDEAAHDDVFLEAAEIVHFAGDGRFGEDAGGLLESGGGDERVGRKRRLGDAQEKRTARCGAAAIGDHAIVFLAEAELVHLLFEDEGGLADVFDFDPAHHLARDGLDVLVVDVHTLETVNLLNGVDQVGLGELLAEDGEQVVQVERAVNEGFARLDVVAFLNVDVDATGNGIFLGGFSIFAFDKNLAHALGDIAILDHTVDFADDSGVLGLAGFKQLDDARETAGDVLRFGGFARDLREHIACLDFVTVLHHQVGAGRHEVLFAHLSRGIANENGRLVLFIARRERDNKLREAGDVIHLLVNRQAGAQVVKFHGAGSFREDGEGEGIPFGQDLATGDVLAVGYAKARTVYDVVALLLAAFFVHEGNQAGAVHGDERASRTRGVALDFAAFDVAKVDELDDTVVARFERGTLGNAGGGSADVERTHGELGAGFTDGLRGDDADGFAKLDHAAGGQVAAVTESADAAARLAGEHGANADALDTRSLYGVGELFGNLLVHVNDDTALEVLDLVERNAADDAVAQRLNFDAGLDDGLDVDAVGSSAVALVDDDVLRDVDEAASEVAGVGGLQCRVRQALACTVRRDEVFQHGEAFAEVGGDGRFDDLAGRLGHQTAHTGKLADLLFRTASAGVGHNVDGIDAAFLVLVLEGLEHFVSDFFGDVAPDGDDLVVALAVGDGAVQVLLLNFDDFLVGVFDELVLVAGSEHVIDADGDAGLGGVGKT